MIRLGFIGNGFVGSAGRQLECPKNSAIVYDIDSEKCVPPGTTLEQVANCDIVFVSVPTPAEADGSCHLSIVETVVKQLKTARADCFVILRSTVPPGTSKRLGVSFMPEFLTEANYLEDFRKNPVWVYGGTSTERIQQVLTNAKDAGKIVSDTLVQMNTQEAELVKYVRNCFLATKVSFFNEVEQYCRANEMDYEAVRTCAASDARIGLSHTMVPGPDARRGFGGHCFPKDMAAWCYFAPHEHSVVRAANDRNLQVDRPEKDWEKDKGRAVVDNGL